MRSRDFQHPLPSSKGTWWWGGGGGCKKFEFQAISSMGSHYCLFFILYKTLLILDLLISYNTFSCVSFYSSWGGSVFPGSPPQAPDLHSVSSLHRPAHWGHDTARVWGVYRLPHCQRRGTWKWYSCSWKILNLRRKIHDDEPTASIFADVQCWNYVNYKCLSIQFQAQASIPWSR